MIIREAKELARQWVIEEGGQVRGFCGAFFHGSINWLPDDAALPETSDVDVMLVVDGPNPHEKRGKFLYRDVVLEVSYLPAVEVNSPEAVLSRSDLAGSFRASSVIVDPSKRLNPVQQAVSRDFARRRWVYRRCEHAREKALNNLWSLTEGEPFHDQVMHWLFGAGVTTHILLVAGLRNPTVRRRYVAVRELLAGYGYLEFYDTLLEMLGCERMSHRRVEQHLAGLSEAFDAAKSIIRTPFPFAADISDVGRPIAIDGSRELIELGYHREAVFWIVATYSRCRKVLHEDAPPGMRDAFSPGYRRLLADLGINSFADLRRRSEQIEALLPRIWNVAEAIIEANPEIEE